MNPELLGLSYELWYSHKQWYRKWGKGSATDKSVYQVGPVLPVLPVPGLSPGDGLVFTLFPDEQESCAMSSRIETANTNNSFLICPPAINDNK